MNYYTQTGERITFDSLGSGFRDKALELVTAKAAEMQAKEDCFFNDYEKSIKLVVLDGTEDLNAIYQEIYGPDIAGTDNGPADPTFYITEDGFVFESASMYYSPMQLELLTLRFRQQTSGMISQQIFFNGAQDAGGYICKI